MNETDGNEKKIGAVQCARVIANGKTTLAVDLPWNDGN